MSRIFPPRIPVPRGRIIIRRSSPEEESSFPSSPGFGEQRLLVFGLITAGLGYGILSTAHSYYGVLFALLIAGTGAVFQHSLSSALISRVYDGPSGRVALGTYNASGDAGKLLFIDVASLLFGVAIAWQEVVSGYGILALLVVAVLWLGLKRLSLPGAVSMSARNPSTAGGWAIRDRSGFRWLTAIARRTKNFPTLKKA
jgi:hypothetical protein